MKLSEFEEVDSSTNFYFIGIQKQKDGSFRNAKIAGSKICRDQILLLVQNDLIINERLKKLEAH